MYGFLMLLYVLRRCMNKGQIMWTFVRSANYEKRRAILGGFPGNNNGPSFVPDAPSQSETVELRNQRVGSANHDTNVGCKSPESQFYEP